MPAMVFYLMVLAVPPSGVATTFVPGHYSDLPSCQKVADALHEQFFDEHAGNFVSATCIPGDTATVQAETSNDQ